MARRKKKRRLSKFSKLLLASFFIGVLFLGHIKYKEYIEYKDNLEIARLAKIEEEKKKNYNNCLNNKIKETIVTGKINQKVEELNTLLKKYEVAVYYEDLTSGYNFSYKEDEVIYGASLIKLVDALYLLDNNVDLNETMVYESKYIKGSSKGMDAREIGSAVTLNDLMNYSLSISDNTAHVMLIDYIGYNNLRDYGKSLGASVILTDVGGEKYGNQTVKDTNIYLKRAYELINNHKNGDLLKKYMTNDYQNHLILKNEKNIAHKYGSYSTYFHNIGIVFSEYPYTISILTKHGNSNYKEVINTIHKSINELHLLVRENIKDSCYKKIYK